MRGSPRVLVRHGAWGQPGPEPLNVALRSGLLVPVPAPGHTPQSPQVELWAGKDFRTSVAGLLD